MLTTETLFRISKEVGTPVSRVEATVSLLEGGATVPFIARYRKEATGNLDEVKIQGIDEARIYYTALEQRRSAVLANVEAQGKLTEDLKQKIQNCLSKAELEDLYLPFKPRRKTKAGVALALGLGPLADYIWEQTGTEPVHEYAARFVSAPEPDPEPAPAAADSVEPARTEGPGPDTTPAPEPAAEPVGDTVVASTEPAAEMAAPLPGESTEPAAEVPEVFPVSLAPVEEPLPLPQLKAEEAEQTPEQTEAQAEAQIEEQTETPEENAEEAVEVHAEEPVAEGSVEPPAAEETGSAPAAASEKPAPRRRISNVEEAIEGALYILAERVAENSDFRKQFRDKLMKEGVVRASVAPGKEGLKTKYEMYYKFEETVPKIPSHRMLAIRRGARENVLTYTIETDSEKTIAEILPQVIRDSTSQFAPLLERAVRDGCERLLIPSIRNEVRTILRERAEGEAIHVFDENLRSLLLGAPAGPIGVIGIDPGIRTGCKAAVVDETGKYLESQVLQLSDPGKDLEAAEKALLDLIQKYQAKAITIGNGTGSRETESFVRSVLQKNALDIMVVVVNEAGASVYSASKRAREEFPDLDVTLRGAISIARRLQDPLAELVKIEPRAIGVGQYQHDVDQKKLRKSLGGVVSSCVNRVGVDLNTASEDLLKYVSGINSKLAATLIERRKQSGAFSSRNQLREIDGFGDKTFEQAAGFLRIKGGENPLDATAVHPESYPIVEKVAASLNVPVGDLIGNADLVSSTDFRALEAEAGRFTVSDIREELLRPGRDPREKFVAPKFRDDVKEVVDLQEGMELEGRVTNVTNFGAFVDLGVHQDGLVHISELSHKYIQDAREAVKVGDVVKVKVIGVDQTMKRISLSMKALQPKPPRPQHRRKPKGRPQPGPAEAVASGAGQAAAVAERKPRPAGPPPRKPRPEGPRREGRPRDARPPKPPVEVAAPVQAQTMEEKIQALQAKFSGMK